MKKGTALLFPALVVGLFLLSMTAARGAFADGSIYSVDSSEFTVGNTVMFGRYEQDDKLWNEAEEIEWIILAREGDKALLLSKYELDAKPYDYDLYSATWETCNLRQWLNEDFLNAAFTEKEQELISLTYVDNSKQQGNSKWKTNGGNNTWDKIFLLSYNEAWTYFGSNEDRKCTPVPSVRSWILIDGGRCWLRSPGSRRDHAATVEPDGTSGSCHINNYLCVRPALWIDLEALSLQNNASASRGSSNYNGRVISAGDTVVYREHCTYQATQAFNWHSGPYANSDVVGRAEAGDLFDTDLVIRNSHNNMWVKARGEEKYVFAGYKWDGRQWFLDNTQTQYFRFLTAHATVEWPGCNVSNAHAKGSALPLFGTIECSSDMLSIRGYFQGYGAGTSTFPASGTSYSVPDSDLDNALKFGMLPAGDYTLQIIVEYICNRGQDVGSTWYEVDFRINDVAAEAREEPGAADVSQNWLPQVSSDDDLVVRFRDAINGVYGATLVSGGGLTADINYEGERYITYDLEGSRYGDVAIYGSVADDGSGLFVETLEVSVAYSEDYGETSDIFNSVIEAAFNIPAMSFYQEVYNGCRYWEDESPTPYDVYISDSVQGTIYGESGYIILELSRTFADDPGYYVGALTVVDCDWARMYESASADSACVTEIPRWAEVDAYYYDHEWYACFYNGHFGFVQERYLTDWPERYEGYYD